MPAVAERSRRVYPAFLEWAGPGVGSIPANSNAQNVPSFRRWRFEMKLSPFLFIFYIIHIKMHFYIFPARIHDECDLDNWHVEDYRDGSSISLRAGRWYQQAPASDPKSNSGDSIHIQIRHPVTAQNLTTRSVDIILYFPRSVMIFLPVASSYQCYLTRQGVARESEAMIS
jgi:hypothetical protein